jgi:hypothetical protein
VTRQELTALIGRELGVSDWFAIDQASTHSRTSRSITSSCTSISTRESHAVGGTIAHRFLTMSLLVHLVLPFIPEFAKRKLVVNYGFDEVRFAAPVRVGKRIRAACKLGAVEERKPGHVMMRIDVSVEIENEDEPALVAEWWSLHVVDQSWIQSRHVVGCRGRARSVQVRRATGR